MASTTLTADRRWASSRKSGMTVLGKVPKPINLPSQRLENNGLDPNVEIVPKGTITWGSRPTSSNAWNSSSSILSPKIEVTASSPPDLIGRPDSSGSSTRPSTGNTDRQLGPDPSHAWGPNSRPSSASGSFASGHPLASANRPRSADTRPGSSHLSRFAESSGESKGFTLSSGDFPTLGAEKPAESHRGHSSHGRPTSGAGRDARSKEAFDTLPSSHDSHVRPTSGSSESNMSKAPDSGDFAKATDDPQNQNVNILKTEDPSNTNWYSETPYQYPTHPYHQSGPNQPNIVLPIPPPQYDASTWRALPPQPMQQNPEGAMWYPPGPHAPAPHGAGPYRPTGPPNNYPIDQFVYYPPPPHFRPPNGESAPQAHFPPPHSAYMMPAHPVSIPGRHGVHAPYASVPPVSFDGGFYGPSRPGFYGNRGHNHNNNRSNYHNSNNNQQAILNQGQNQSVGSSVMGSDVAPKQYKLLKHKEEEKKDEKQPEPSAMTHGKDHVSEHCDNQKQPIVRKNPALIQKIEELNSKARSLESFHAEIKEEKPKPGEGILGTPSGVSEAGGMSIHLRTGEEVTTVRQHHAERRSNEQRRMRQRPGQVPNQVSPGKNDALLENISTGSDKVHSLRKEGDDSMASDANLPSSDPAEYEIQRLLLKEKAAQRAKELQREEEERIREQRAKALAKLEELNRRATTQKEPVNKESEPSPPISDSHFQQEHSDVITADTADTCLQEAPLKSAEISSVATVTLSFGTISEVQITTGQVTHISEVPISSMKTSADAGVIADAPVTGSGANAGPSGVVNAGTGTSSHARHHNGKTGYKKRHSSNINPPPELKAAEKTANVGAVLENPTEHLQQTDTQVTVGDSAQHKDDIVANHRKRGNRNPKSRSKTEVPLPVSVPVQSAVPFEERPGKGLNEKVETVSSTAPTSENTNSVLPEDSSKDVSKPLEVELYAGGGNTRAGPHWKAQQQRRPVRNHRTISDKSHSNDNVVWAPVKHPKEESTYFSGTSATSAAPKYDGEVHTGVKTKRAEIERYVPKPQLSQLEKKPDDSSDVNVGEMMPPPETKSGEVDSRTNIGSNSTNHLNKSMRRGKPHASWRQRVGPVEMHETMFPNPTDGEKTLASDMQSVMPTPAPKDHEDDVDERPRRHNGHKLYKATGSNYGDQSAGRSETENMSENVDGAITGIEGKSQNMESDSCGVLNHNSTIKLQHWKPKSQSHVYSHGKGNVGWQKVVSDKVGPISGKGQDEDKPVASSAGEVSGAVPRRQRGNARQYKSGTSEERESNREFQPVVRSYQRVTEEDGMEGSERVATGSRHRGRGRSGYFARPASELSI